MVLNQNGHGYIRTYIHTYIHAYVRTFGLTVEPRARQLEWLVGTSGQENGRAEKIQAAHGEPSEKPAARREGTERR
eukprot:3777201-Heterocapsa_arctica.AAC.1